MKKLDYQLKACEQIVESINKENKIVRLQAPTGSGKTYITSLFIERILQSKLGLENPNLTFVYIAPSTGQLDYQGFKKISSYINKGYVSGFKTEYIGTSNGNSKNFIANIDRFERKKVYFIGWDILRAKSRIFSENENGNIFDIVRNTHANDTKIVLIIDEAHREYPDNLPAKEQNKSDSKLRQKFLDELNPYRAIEMSATLLHKKRDGIDVLIKAIDVKESGAIKQEIIINDTTDNLEEKDKIVQLITSGILKRDEIENSISKISENTDWDINPLVLIQIPDKSSKVGNLDVEEYYLNLIKESLNKFGMSENFDYTYWLDGKNKHFTKDQIADNKSNIKVLIFKQAIATGWDVPRACVLIKLRDPKNGSKAFEVQTLGRILRNPFMKIFAHGGKNKLLKEDILNLNSAFVFTNDKDWKERNLEIKDYGVDIKDKEYKEFKISKKALDNPLKINTVKVEYNSKNYIALVEEIFNDNNFVELLIKKVSNYNHDQSIDQISNSKLLGEDVAMNVIAQYQEHSSLNLSSSSYGLFYIYSQYITTISNVEVLKVFFDEFASKYKINKKKMYWFVIDNFMKTFDNGITLQQSLNEILGNVINKMVTFEKDTLFELKHSIDYDLNSINVQMSDFIQAQNDDVKSSFINSYELEFEISEAFKASQNEKILYKNLYELNTEEKKKIHVFRNKTNVNNSFYVEYFKISENREALFFPDFIITTESKVYIVEAKGLGSNDIDDNSSIKMNTLSTNKKLITQNKDVVIVKVGMHKNSSELEIHIFNNNEIKPEILHWKEFEKMLLKDWGL